MAAPAKERPVAVVTGTSRDVGEKIVYGLAIAGWDVLGIYRNSQHQTDQKFIQRRVEAFGGRMGLIMVDLTDPGTPYLVAKVLEEDWGGRVSALVMNAARGLRGSAEESIEFNFRRNLGLLSGVAPFMPDGSSVIYEQSLQAHTNDMELIAHLPIEYQNVRMGKRAAEAGFRKAFSEGGEFAHLRLGVVVGNGLTNTFATKVGERRDPEGMKYWASLSESGILPSDQEYASKVVEVATKPYPSGHTEYVGVAPQHRLLLPDSYYGLLKGAPPMQEGSIMTRDQLEEITPFRWPFSFVGAVDSVEFGKSATGRLVDLRHPDINWRHGHFPQRELVPGVITQEALNQLGALVVLGMPEYRGRMAVLTGMEKVDFKRIIEPGDNVGLEVEADLHKMRGRVLGKGHTRAVNAAKKTSVDGIISFALV